MTGFLFLTITFWRETNDYIKKDKTEIQIYGVKVNNKIIIIINI